MPGHQLAPSRGQNNNKQDQSISQHAQVCHTQRKKSGSSTKHIIKCHRGESNRKVKENNKLKLKPPTSLRKKAQADVTLTAVGGSGREAGGGVGGCSVAYRTGPDRAGSYLLAQFGETRADEVVTVADHGGISNGARQSISPQKILLFLNFFLKLSN